jgi:dephospho-CoA kinase
MTIIIGISGGVASGKNFISDCFLEFGAKIFDADNEVSKLFSNDLEFQKIIQTNFPNFFQNGKINKNIIVKEVFNDKKKLQLLEDIIHPIINHKKEDFIKNCKSQNITIAILNIPLLFEKESYKKCDIAILAISDLNLRKERFLLREKNKNSEISDELLSKKFNNIILNQKSDQEKSKLADFIIYNNSDKKNIITQIKSILKNYEDNNS